MPYVRRGNHGEIAELLDSPSENAIEHLDADDPAILRFLERTAQVSQVKRDLGSTDLDTIRVIEDLIEALLRKGVIHLADLPDSAKAKLGRRQELRRILRETPLMSDDVL